MTAFLRLAVLLLAIGAAPPAGAHGDQEIQQGIAFEQRIGATLPGDLAFTEADGRRVRLGELLGGKPVVLLLAWYSCPNLCPVALDGLASGLRALPFTPAKDFRVVTLSIDPRDGPPEARQVRADLARRNGAGPESWHVLTGEAPAIGRLAEAIGFGFVYDAETDQYGHPAGVVLIDTRGRVARYLFGLRFAARDLRLGLLEAGRGELGSPVDQLVLRCHAFDPETGQYNLAVMNLLRVAGGGFALILLSVVGAWWLKEARSGSLPNRSGSKDEDDGGRR